MKKPSADLVRRRKLVLHREVIASLAPHQLRVVAAALLAGGGDSYWPPCPASDQ